jgi:drug/metabolite transporter (DMT)-like permease
MMANILKLNTFGYAAQSLLAALGSVQFVTNVFFAYVLLNEVVTRRIVLATIFIMAGNVFLVAFGNHQSLSKASLLHVLRTNKLAIARIVDAPQNCCILFLLLIGCVQINFDKR